MYTWHQGLITRIEPLSPGVRRFFMEVPSALSFQPGQFITMDLPIHERRLKRWRSYSIASAPSEGSVWEFCIGRLEGGLATRYLFEDVAPGSTLIFKGPEGQFTLPATLPAHLVLVCTGTGVAPFRSMLMALQAQWPAETTVHLIFGCRSAQDILYREAFEALAAAQPRFRYHIALSREEAEGCHKGYVHALYESLDLPPDAVFYLCGWQKMIDEARERLKNMGFPEKQVRYELYG